MIAVPSVAVRFVKTFLLVAVASIAGELASDRVSRRLSLPEHAILAAVLVGLLSAVGLGIWTRLRPKFMNRRSGKGSGRRRADAQNAGLATAITHATDSVVITDPEGIIQYVNPAFSKITGYSAEEAIGQSPRFLKSGKQDAALYRDLWKTIRNGQIWQGEVINRRKDGTFVCGGDDHSPDTGQPRRDQRLHRRKRCDRAQAPGRSCPAKRRKVPAAGEQYSRCGVDWQTGRSHHLHHA